MYFKNHVLIPPTKSTLNYRLGFDMSTNDLKKAEFPDIIVTYSIPRSYDELDVEVSTRDFSPFQKLHTAVATKTSK